MSNVQNFDCILYFYDVHICLQVLISITSGMVKKVVPYIGCLVAAKVYYNLLHYIHK